MQMANRKVVGTGWELPSEHFGYQCMLSCTLFERPRETHSCWGRGDSQQPAVGQAQEPAKALAERGEPGPRGLTQLLIANSTGRCFVPVESGAGFFFLWRALQIRRKELCRAPEPEEKRTWVSTQQGCTQRQYTNCSENKVPPETLWASGCIQQFCSSLENRSSQGLSDALHQGGTRRRISLYQHTSA